MRAVAAGDGGQNLEEIAHVHDHFAVFAWICLQSLVTIKSFVLSRFIRSYLLTRSLTQSSLITHSLGHTFSHSLTYSLTLTHTYSHTLTPSLSLPHTQSSGCPWRRNRSAVNVSCETHSYTLMRSETLSSNSNSLHNFALVVIPLNTMVGLSKAAPPRTPARETEHPRELS